MVPFLSALIYKAIPLPCPQAEGDHFRVPSGVRLRSCARHCHSYATVVSIV